MRAKQRMPSISLATVYNCLETLVDCGLAKQVNMERDATRYCPNLDEHGHFMCERCGKVFDVPLAASHHIEGTWDLPRGFTVTHSDFTLRGICADCTR
jgi:Fur family peroxide stress response transcriptional regulator